MGRLQGRDRGRAGLADRGAADCARTASRPSERRAGCTPASRPRSARGSSTPRRRCRRAAGSGRRRATRLRRAGGLAGYGAGVRSARRRAASGRHAWRSIASWRCARRLNGPRGRSRRAASARRSKPREQAKADKQFDSTLEQRGDATEATSCPLLASQSAPRLDPRLQDCAIAAIEGARESGVMRDAREVAARRKRQLGRDAAMTRARRRG